MKRKSPGFDCERENQRGSDSEVLDYLLSVMPKQTLVQISLQSVFEMQAVSTYASRGFDEGANATTFRLLARDKTTIPYHAHGYEI